MTIPRYLMRSFRFWSRYISELLGLDAIGLVNRQIGFGVVRSHFAIHLSGLGITLNLSQSSFHNDSVNEAIASELI